MTIPLSLEQEQVVEQAIRAGLIRVPGDVVGVGLRPSGNAWKRSPIRIFRRR